MNKPFSITRRAAVLGALAAGVVSTEALADELMAAAAEAGAAIEGPSAVMEAIAAHKRAMREVRRISRVCDPLECLPGHITPRVRYAWLLKGRDADGNDVREPLFAYSHEQIDSVIDADIHTRTSWGEKYSEHFEARRAALHRELTKLTRRQNAFERRIGLTEATAKLDNAYECESECAAALILAKPTTEAEATSKARYMRRFGSGWWTSSDTRRALLRACCSVRRRM